MGSSVTKTHLVVNSHSNTIPFILSDGINHDIKVLKDLIDKMSLSDTDVLCVNKGYDFESLRCCCDTIIPRKQNAKFANNHMNFYKARHLVENAFAKLKKL